ncbi:hypothetical protein IMSAG192_00682 [Muribaculaceae bacterium]|nr:hypothetical protein IMSAG192_00682 [Muribaculaceae bacterium]
MAQSHLIVNPAYGGSLKICFHIGIFSDSAHKLILDKFHIRVEIVMAWEIFMLGLVNLYLAHMRQVYHQLQERMIKFVGLIERCAERTAGIYQRRAHVGIIVERGIKHSESLVVAVDCKVGIGTHQSVDTLVAQKHSAYQILPQACFIINLHRSALAHVFLEYGRFFQSGAVYSSQRSQGFNP